MPAATPATLRQSGLPIVELKRVQLPDYLDTTDAHWSIVDGAHRQIHIAEETSLVQPINGTDDNAIVQAMSHILEDLAERLAGAIEKDR
jgi:hypothetical protein